MSRMWLYGIALVLVMALSGALAGYLFAPRYQRPAEDGESRLRERAAEYFRAIQVRDHLTMSRAYTPARQVAERERLLITADDQARMYQNFKPETRATFEATAASITPAALVVELVGDWAVTTGMATTKAGDADVPIGLGDVVWVRSAGEWWVYTMTYAELNAYGNPPDFARKILKMQSTLGTDPATMEIEMEDTPANEGVEDVSANDLDETGSDKTADDKTAGQGDDG